MSSTLPLAFSVDKENLPPTAAQATRDNDASKSPVHASQEARAKGKKASNSKRSSKAKATVSKSTKAVWTDHDDRLLINTLLDEREKGHQSDSGFKAIAYTACMEALAHSESESGGALKTAKSCQDRWTTVSRDSEEFHIRSSFSCHLSSSKVNSRLSRSCGSTQALDGMTRRKCRPLQMMCGPSRSRCTFSIFLILLIAQSCQAIGPKAEKWRTKSFPLYDDILAIVDGIIATGENAFRAGHDDPATQASSSFDAVPDDDEELADEEDIDNSQDVATTPGPSTQAPVKRAARTSPETSRTSKRQRANSAGFQRLCDALEGLASSIISPSSSSGPVTTPERRARAIALVEDSDDLSDNERLLAFDLFSEKPEVADSYVAIKKPALRTQFLQGKLEKFIS
jgi:hypothetical protein